MNPAPYEPEVEQRWGHTDAFEESKRRTENDARFAANIDKHGAGLTTFLVAAIRANSERAASRGSS